MEKQTKSLNMRIIVRSFCLQFENGQERVTTAKIHRAGTIHDLNTVPGNVWNLACRNSTSLVSDRSVSWYRAFLWFIGHFI